MRLPTHIPRDVQTIISPLARCAVSVALASCLASTIPTLPSALPAPALAVSGGGKDYSGMSLESQDFSGQKLNGKEFRGIRGANAVFKDAALKSTSFFQADLSNANFAGADLTGASLEEAGLDGVSLENAVLVSSYLTRTISDAQSITGADFSDSIIPEKTAKALCTRADAKGINPTTQIPTRESLMCPD